MKINKLINMLVEMERAVGDVEVDVRIEQFKKTETTQLEEKLTHIDYSNDRVILLGESFE